MFKKVFHFSAKRLKASTLVETVVAMTLVMIAFGIALTLFLNINKHDQSFQKLKARFILKQQLHQIKDEVPLLDDQLELNGITVSRSVSNYPGYGDLKLVLWEAYSADGRKLGVYRKIVADDQN